MSIEKERERIKKLNEKIIDKSEKVQKEIQGFKRNAATTTETSNLWWSKNIAGMKESYKKMKDAWKLYANTEHPLVYKTEVKKEIARLNKMRLVRQKTKPFTKLMKRNVNRNALQALIDQTIFDFVTSLNDGEKMNISLMRRLQAQLKTSQEAIDLAIAEGISRGEGTNAIAKRLQKELLEEWTIKAGSKRYDVKTYTEIIARTRTRDVQSQATLNTAVATENDLFQVSSHNTTTPICLPFEGKVFSISGRDPDFPPATDTPAFHPNCQHVITVYVKDYARITGTLDQSIAFSNNNTEIHPTRRSHKTMAQRGIPKEIIEKVKGK